MTQSYDSGEAFLVHETEAPEDVETESITPIPVVVSNAVTVNTITAQNLVTSTYVLTETQPIAQIAELDPLRTGLYMMSLDDHVVLCHSLQQAQDPNNQSVGLDNPNGFVLLRSSSALTLLPVKTTQPLWVVGNSFPSRVSVLIERRTP